MIFDERATLDRTEAVLVYPATIGTPNLLVDKEDAGDSTS